ncbi:NAD-dependent epimerase/dehydratase family protein [Corallococcus macrosporus]|uniref:NAD-dependent epimerase/dehydratase family protein n=2 Tax=Myxococcaceae TaxID=31 RepID=F8C9F0_MYXFH|nr:NAD-dependent epimerase/dehydratase family protein [Corallococcus macrosporus]
MRAALAADNDEEESMDTDITHVLLVGGTGRFGGRLASALLARPGIHLHVLVRPGTHGDALAEHGVTWVRGSLDDMRSLDSALEGVDAVVSAVDGAPEVRVEGQLRLLDSARRHGVIRFIPSDYSLDYADPESGGAFMDAHRQVADAVVRSGVPHSFVLCGAFMETALSPRAQVFDFERGVVSYWGTGDEPFDVTSMADAARWVAEVVVDPRATGRRLEFVGDVATVNGVAALYEELTGHVLRRVCKGGVEDLRRQLARVRPEGVTVQQPSASLALLAQLAGKGRLREPANAEYPRLRPVSVRAFLQSRWMLPSAASAALPLASQP